MTRTRHSVATATLLAALLSMGSLGVNAQDEAQPTVAEINAGSVSGATTLDGVVLERVPGEDEDFFFSDGTGIVIIDAERDIPLLTLITIDGQVADDEIDVRSWAPAEAPMADAGPTTEAFMAWVAALAGDDMGAVSDETAATDDGEPTEASATPVAEAVEELVVSGRRELNVDGPAAVRCDGGGNVYVRAAGAEVSVTGACREIDVEGSDNTISVTETRELNVSGNGNTIALEQVREIYVDGNDNTISYAQGGRDIDDEGRGNTIARS